ITPFGARDSMPSIYAPAAARRACGQIAETAGRAIWQQSRRELSRLEHDVEEPFPPRRRARSASSPSNAGIDERERHGFQNSLVGGATLAATAVSVRTTHAWGVPASSAACPVEGRPHLRESLPRWAAGQFAELASILV